MLTDALTPPILESGIEKICDYFLGGHKVPMIDWVSIHFGVKLLMGVFFKYFTSLDKQKCWIYLKLEQMNV